MVLRRMMGPSLETGAVFDAVLSVNYCANCDSVSVRAVREKCDEKRQGVKLGKPMRYTAVESTLCAQSARKEWGTRQVAFWLF
jgi:hypothetical protein